MNFGSSSFVLSQVAKVRFVHHLVHSVPPNAMVLFTDLDVVPLRPYSELLSALPSHREATWMYNSQKHAPANGGFYVLKNTPSVRGACAPAAPLASPVGWAARARTRPARS